MIVRCIASIVYCLVMSRVLLLGISLDALTSPETLDWLRAFLRDGKQHHVATPNNEMLVEAHRNPAFRVVLNRTDLNLPDSTGLVLMARLTGQRLPQRVTGVDTVQRLCAQLNEDTPVFLLGAGEGIAERAAKVLQERNARLRISGALSGSPSDADAPAILETIRNAAPAILFVAYGAPAQEFWIDKHLKDLPSVRIAMGVGGTFDFLAGTQKRAPAFLRSIGLEWAWRFFFQPSRYKRMWNAVIVFPALVMKNFIVRGGVSPR